MEPLAQLLIPFRQSVDGLQARLIKHAAEVEIDHDISGIVLGYKQVAKPGHASKEEHAMQLVDPATVLVGLHIGHVKRDFNKWADAITNDDLSGFSESKRLDCEVLETAWQVLPALLELGTEG